MSASKQSGFLDFTKLLPDNQNLSLAPSGKSLALVRPARAAMRDASRSSRNVARVAMDAAASGGASRRTKRLQRTAKSCGPGAATVASIHAGLCWHGNGDKKRRSPGRVRISRQTIAQGRPGCLGCTWLIRVRPFYHLHTVLRAQSAPGFPCALCQREGQRDRTTRTNHVARTRRRDLHPSSFGGVRSTSYGAQLRT